MLFKMACKGVVLALLTPARMLFAQQPAIQIPTSVNASLVVDAAGPEQRRSLGAIYLIVCPGVGVGTGFLIESGVVVTNAHVAANCDEENLFGVTSANRRIRFSKVLKDSVRDLALLVPKDTLPHGFRLSATDNPPPGTVVSTWGFPLLYNGTTPLLSVGYVSGFRTVITDGKPVKHIVVNGAFNRGNSGGPLLVSHSNAVIGVVVLTFHFYPPEVKQFIDGLLQMRSGFQIGTRRNPDGTTSDISEAQVTAMVLQEFYEKTQVMIGEAVSGSEVAAMLKEHYGELPHKPVQAVGAKRKSTEQIRPR